jgi:hypothetical protein
MFGCVFSFCPYVYQITYTPGVSLFPSTADTNIISAISIGRRLQDPLSEYVKGGGCPSIYNDVFFFTDLLKDLPVP